MIASIREGCPCWNGEINKINGFCSNVLNKTTGLKVKQTVWKDVSKETHGSESGRGVAKKRKSNGILTCRAWKLHSVVRSDILTSKLYPIAANIERRLVDGDGKRIVGPIAVESRTIDEANRRIAI